MISKSTFLLFILYSYVFLASSQMFRPLPVENMPINKIDAMNDV